MKKSVTVSAPGKLMLLGEHSVVYGYPSIVTAMDTRLYVKVSDSSCEDLVIAPQVKECKFVESSIALFKKEFNIDKNITIETYGDFSHQVGLGSSSAVTVSTFKALSDYFNKKLSLKDIFDLSYKVTLNIQGVGSGFDIAAATYGATLYYLYGGKKIETIHKKEIPIVIGYSGIKADTPTLIRRVRESYCKDNLKTKEIFRKISVLVEKARISLEKDNFKELGSLFTQNHQLLKKLNVSTDKLDLMVKAAINNGAYGAKLSGAGGGDCMIALVPKDCKTKVERAIEKAGGVIINVGNNACGVKVEEKENLTNEYLTIVDRNDNVIGFKNRKDCHCNNGIIHRAIAIAIFNSKGHILIQKRGRNKDIYPGYYTLSATGHVDKGESYFNSAIRELREELGITPKIVEIGKHLTTTKDQSEMIKVYKAIYEGPLRINKSEVESVQFISRENIAKIIDKLTPTSINSLKLLKFI